VADAFFLGSDRSPYFFCRWHDKKKKKKKKLFLSVCLCEVKKEINRAGLHLPPPPNMPAGETRG
jgi:hypothetical protein